VRKIEYVSYLSLFLLRLISRAQSRFARNADAMDSTHCNHDLSARCATAPSTDQPLPVDPMNDRPYTQSEYLHRRTFYRISLPLP
jgi:hypothetical protein